MVYWSGGDEPTLVDVTQRSNTSRRTTSEPSSRDVSRRLEEGPWTSTSTRLDTGITVTIGSHCSRRKLRAEEQHWVMGVSDSVMGNNHECGITVLEPRAVGRNHDTNDCHHYTRKTG